MNQEQVYKEIVEHLGIEDWPKEKQDEALAEVLDEILQQAVIIAHDSLPEDKRAAFVHLVEEGGDAEELIDIFSGTVEGKGILDKAVQTVLEALKEAEE